MTADKITLDTVIKGTTQAFETQIRKLRTNASSLLEIINKRGLNNNDYQLLVQFQDSLIGAYDSAGTLTSLLLVQHNDPVVKSVDAPVSKAGDSEES